MTFANRLKGSQELEHCVIRGLRERGWLAYQFGQGQIPADARDLLRRYKDDAHRPSLLRWMPDIIALRDSARTELVLVDAKRGDGPRYAIETRSVEAAEVFVGRLFVPVFFVCDDGGVLTPRDVRERGVSGPVTASTAGSRTPYLLVEKHWAKPFDDIFGNKTVPVTRNFEENAA